MKDLNLFRFTILQCLFLLFLLGCSGSDCNPAKQFTDPRTPSGVQHPTEAACQAALATTCNFANGNVAQTMGRLVGNCVNYCKTPLTGDNKACNPVTRNFNTGKAVCEPEPLPEDEPTYYHIVCQNLSVDCSCEE